MASESTSSFSYSSRPSAGPGTELLRLDPSTLCKEGEGGTPQLAKDEDYASAIMKAWRDELDTRTSSNNFGRSVASPFIYKCPVDGSSLFGHIYRPSPSPVDPSPALNSLPGIVLFHTGAGPQDAFLRWKADSLVNEREVFGEGGCVVLLADIIGDSSGWAWHDREKYADARRSVLVPDENGERRRLKGRVRAAVDALAARPGVDAGRIGAMGFCLGGHAILELARTRHPSIRAMATFHGVFDGARGLSPVGGGDRGGRGASAEAAGCKVLVCTGEDDPFVPAEDLDAAMQMFDDSGCRSDLMKFERARHGFTNPAQDYNPNEAFAYSEEACAKAWNAALSLLKETIC